MVSFIRVSAGLKRRLDELKQSQTYEEFLSELIKERVRLRVAKSMQEYSTASLTEVKAWEHTEPHW